MVGKQPAHMTSLRSEIYQSILPPWPGLSRIGTPARSATHFIWCLRWLPPPHLPWPSRRPLPCCLLPAPNIMQPTRSDTTFFTYLPTSATEWWIGDRSAISGALTPLQRTLFWFWLRLRCEITPCTGRKWEGNTKTRNSWMEERKKN
jgi:hypothetical protein